MSVIPLLPQPVRAQRDAAPVPERRRADAGGDRFAESLATARGDRAPSSQGSATCCDRASSTSTPTTEGDDYASTKARLAAQQRSQLQALMLSGAMKFAVTRTDVPVNGTLLDAVTSQPDVIDTPVLADTTAVFATIVGAPEVRPDVSAVASDPTVGAPAERDPEIVARALPTDNIVQSLPEVTIIPADFGFADASVEPETTTDPAVTLPDLSATSAATVAALQLIATLPIDVALPAPEPDPAAPDAALKSAPVPDTGAFDAPVNGELSSLPECADTVLVEDHFDVPAASIGVATATAATIAPDDRNAAPSATSETNVASAATSAASAAGTDVTTLQNDLARLDPGFRDRLQKVIDRMRTEFGHAVKVVETVRSQSRQDALFAQGRSAPGPVVTWTRDSKHGKGLAADLMVDGAWQNPVGYAHLADVAKQEGLRTLGTRDAGHVEMPTGSSVSGETLGNLLSDLQGDAGDAARQLRADVNIGRSSEEQASIMARVANVAQVARVATVANVAQVAKVATVARPGASPALAAGSSAAISPLAVSAVPAIATNSDSANVIRLATPVSAVNMADRISHLMDLQATQDAKPLNSVLLRMDNANGIEDQIRIDTRGTSVDARLGLGNAQQAAVFTDRLGELREALERRGLTADGVRVQAASSTRATDSVNFSRPIAPTLELAAMRAAADSQAHGNTRDQSARDQAQREQFARDQSRHTPRSSSDDARQRSRREQPEERR